MALILSSATGSSSTLPSSSASRKKKKRTRLLEAVGHGNVEKIIKLLVTCDPNFVDESSGETPLSVVANNTTFQTTTTQRLIVALVNGGAILDFRTKDGRTALHVAVLKSNYVALKTLLGLGGSPNYQDSNGLTPLFYSVIHKSNAKLTQLLLHENASIGCADQQGWQELHHACKLGLSGHLENLLYYGADMGAKIVGSGNTGLHVAAINDQKDCAKLLLLRGCDTSLVNNSHQTAHQVAVIAGNLDLATTIQNFRPEQVIPFREKPKYNPARQRPPEQQPSHQPASESSSHSSSGQTSNTAKSMSNSRTGCPSSPCLSQRSCATSTTVSTSTTSSSGVCCELDHSSQTESLTSDDDPRTQISATSHRIEGRREQKLSGSACTLPSRGRRAAGTSLVKQDSQTSNSSASESSTSGTGAITSFREKTVSLHRGKKGFGFVLRGAKASSPVLRSIQSSAVAEKGVTAVQPISLQYLDEIEVGGVAQLAGLAKGDFLLTVNGIDVRKAPHEQVVNIIRQSGDKVTMSVAAPVYQQLDPHDSQQEIRDGRDDKSSSIEESDSSSLLTSAAQGDTGPQPGLPKSGSQTLPSRSQVPSSGSVDAIVDSMSRSRSRAPPPAPPKRDPSTTLTVGRSRAKSLCITGRKDGSSEETSSTDALSAESSSAGTHQRHEHRDNDDDECCDGANRHVEQRDDGCESHSDSNVSGLASSGTSICGINNNNKHDNYDSEGRSDKSSCSASTSIESMIPNANCSTRQHEEENQSAVSGKVASIRSRVARRMSALELKDFFSRQQSDVSSSPASPSSKSQRHTGGKHSTQTLKSKKNKKGTSGSGTLSKSYHSVPDLQQELLQEMRNGAVQTVIESAIAANNNAKSGRLSNSQEDVGRDSMMRYAVETVTLKNGRIVQDHSPAPVHAPPPPPPPPPPPQPPMSSSSNDSTLPVTCLPPPPPSHLMAKAADAADFHMKSQPYDQNRGNSAKTCRATDPGMGMSSFKAPAAASIPSVCEASNETSSLPTGDSVSKDSSNALKPMKHPVNRSATSQASVYARQATMDLMDERNSKPFIPEPDYSSDDETAEATSGTAAPKDLSTFKMMSQSGNAGNADDNKKSNDSAIRSGSEKSCGSKALPQHPHCDPKSMSRSDSDHDSGFPPPPPALSTALMSKESSDVLNKVKASIREFERRSSLTGSETSGTTSSSAVTSVSISGSSNGTNGTAGATTGCKPAVATKSPASSSQGTDAICNSTKTGIHHQGNSIRMSRSCYEVESCSGSSGTGGENSSGIASDADEPFAACTLTNAKVQTLNRRNSAIVSDKMAHLIAQSKPNPAAGQTMSQAQQLTSSLKQQGSRTLEKRVSIAEPPEQPALTFSARAAPTTAKTWSEISSAIRAVKGSPVSQAMAGQTVRPVSAPTAKQLSKSSKEAVLSGVNEVDVMAELVPPPPQFAAPPPHHRVQIQVKSSDPRLAEVSLDNMVRVVNPSTGQMHTIHKPQVKSSAVPGPQLHQQLHLQTERKTATPPSSSSSSTAATVAPETWTQSAGTRLSVSLHSGQAMGTAQAMATGQLMATGQSAAARTLTPQQKAQFDYLQKQHQLSQQQFATLSRAYSGAHQQARLIPVSASGTALSHQSHAQQAHIVQVSRGTENVSAGNRSPKMGRAQFSIISDGQQQPALAFQSGGQGYQQYGTLSRAGQKALVSAAANGQQGTYNDFARLAVQSRGMRQGQQLCHEPVGQHQVVQWTPQQLQQLTPQQRQAIIHKLQQQQQQQHHQQQQQQLQPQQVYILHQHPQDLGHSQSVRSHAGHQHVHGKGQAPPPPPTSAPPPTASQAPGGSKGLPVVFPRKSMIEWTADDVADWLTSIGMSDYRPAFENVNGVKLLRLENNDLSSIGLRQGQHRVYLLEKVKQYMHYQQQHPPAAH